MLAAALKCLAAQGVEVLRAGPVLVTEPVGPSLRRYANSAALVRSDLAPTALLALLKQVEHAFGRRASGQRWRSRVLDLDIVLWRGGAWTSPGLTIPHPLFRHRDFVLTPAAAIAPDWRDPMTGLTVRQLRARLTGPRPLPRCPTWWGP